MSDDLDAILAKFADTPERTIQIDMVGREIVRAAALYADPASHDEAALLFKGWSQMGGDSLRKAIATHFIDRARAIVRTGSVTGNGPALGAVHPMIARLRARKTGAPPPGGPGGPAPGVKNMGKLTPDVHPMIERLRKAQTHKPKGSPEGGQFAEGGGGGTSAPASADKPKGEFDDEGYSPIRALFRWKRSAEGIGLGAAAGAAAGARGGKAGALLGGLAGAYGGYHAARGYNNFLRRRPKLETFANLTAVG